MLRRHRLSHLTAITFPDGHQELHSYANGAVSGITFAAGSTQLTAASGVTWQPMDTALASWIASNGLANTLSYDTDGRLVGIHVPGVESLGFSYDAANRLTGIDNAIDGTQSQDFGYDEQSRLVAMTSGRAVASYGYDTDGNRIAKTVGGATDTTGYSPTSNHMTSTIGADAQSYGYDALGNVTALDGTPTCQYDAFNRLSAAAGTSYTVSPEGQRLRKSGGAGTTYFAPDASGTLLAEDDNGRWIDYVWLGGRLIGREVNGQLEAIGDDQLGRPQVVTNAARQVVWSAQNWPFTRSVAVSSSAPLNLGFPGQYYDQETGLWNNGFRDYDPALGRYVESDPLGLAAGVNTYAYVGGNPLTGADQLGLCDSHKCETPPSLPGGESYKSNIQQIEMTRAFAGSAVIFSFYNLVRNGGPWDYKQRGHRYQAAGNFNYGVTGAAAGFSTQLLLRAAGYAQIEAGTSLPAWRGVLGPLGAAPYGDDPADQVEIKAGIAYYNCLASGGQ